MATDRKAEVENIATKNIPEIRRMLADCGFPSDLPTAIKVRRAARAHALQWGKESLKTTDESRLHFLKASK
jgi:hypothetical protein